MVQKRGGPGDAGLFTVACGVSVLAVMERDELEGAATPEQLAAAVERYRDDLARLQHAHERPTESVRELTYKGHHIRIVTTYRIEADGAPITGHLSVPMRAPCTTTPSPIRNSSPRSTWSSASSTCRQRV
jgi:hypothetical protein